MKSRSLRFIASIISSSLILSICCNSLYADKLDLVSEKVIEASSQDDTVYYFDPVKYTVNTGKDNGFSGDSVINANDPHSGWQLGIFSVKGFSKVIEKSNGEIIFLKNLGDQLVFDYELYQDIDCLNNDETVSIYYDKDCTDTALQVPRQDFGRGALFVKKCDYSNKTTFPVEYTSYLEAKQKNANTKAIMFEEGDYSVALDYEIEDSRNIFGATTFFGHKILPSYTNYRYAFNFKIRNSNCMAYPIDLKGNELFDGDVTSTGFKLDLAKSRYLTVDVKYLEIVNGRPVVRGDRIVKEGTEYTNEGIYTITVSNEVTGKETVMTIFVGDSPELMLYADLNRSEVVQDVIDENETKSDNANSTGTNQLNSGKDSIQLDSLDFEDSDTMSYIEGIIYRRLLDELDENYYVQNVTAIYLSQEYLDELDYNSQENVFFGYSLTELDEVFEGERYVFIPVGNETKVQLLESYGNIDIYDEMLENVVVGAGVIVVFVTVGVATYGVAPAISVCCFAGAEKGVEFALSGAAIGGVTSLCISEYETGNIDLSIDSALISASEGFKIGAVIGCAQGATEAAIALKGATLHGLTMNEAALIQRETGWDVSFISSLHSYEEYEVYRDAGLTMQTVGDTKVLAPQIDWNLIDPRTGKSNAELVAVGKNPIGADGKPVNVHHIGQLKDSPFAILTDEMHNKASGTLHWNNGGSTAEHGDAFNDAKKKIFKYLLRKQAPDLYSEVFA